MWLSHSNCFENIDVKRGKAVNKHSNVSITKFQKRFALDASIKDLSVVPSTETIANGLFFPNALNILKKVKDQNNHISIALMYVGSSLADCISL
jgi:hypothetical protein